MTKREQEVLIDSAVIPEFVADLTFEAIRSRFLNAARSIMLEHKLVRADYCWDITALELYLYRSGIWEDKTTHGFRFRTHKQLESGTWYIHKDGKLPPKRLGIDITAGSHVPEIHVGFLIAAIGETDGSGRAVKTILRGRPDSTDWDYSEQEKNLIVEKIHSRSIRSGPPNLRLIRRLAPKEGRLWIGPRKFGNKKQRGKIKEPFRSCCLRISTFPTTNPPMKLLDEVRSGQ